MSTAAIRLPLVRRARLGRLGDGALAGLAGTGDERAFEALYERHHRPLLGFCRHMLGSHEEAEDALQQTFLRAHRALVEHGPPEEVRPWLFAIARNRCRTLLSARHDHELPDDEVEVATEGLGPEVQRRADLRALLADLQGLPEDQRSALVLGELGDLSHAEIGTVIGVPAEKVKALVFQARSALIAERDARETPCERIREQLATARGGELRRGPLRRHLRGCEPCRAYRAAVSEQRVNLALLLPVLPSAGLKAAVLGAVSAGGGAGTAATVAGGGAGLGSLAAKLAVGAALAGGAGGGAVLVERAAAPDRTPAAVTAPATAPASAGLAGDDVDGGLRPGVPGAAGAAPLRGEGAEGAGDRGARRQAGGRVKDRAAKRARDRAAARARDRAAKRQLRAGERAAKRQARAGERAAKREAGSGERAAEREAGSGERAAPRPEAVQRRPARTMSPAIAPAPAKVRAAKPAPPAAVKRRATRAPAVEAPDVGAKAPKAPSLP